MKKEVIFLLVFLVITISCTRLQKGPELSQEIKIPGGLDDGEQEIFSITLDKSKPYSSYNTKGENIIFDGEHLVFFPSYIEPKVRDASYMGYIVELEDAPKIRYKKDQEAKGRKLSKKDLNDYDKIITLKKDAIKKKVREINPKAKIKSDFKNSFNGFSLEASLLDIKKIEKIEGVKKIYPNYIVKSSLIDSVNIINASKTWQITDSNGNPLTGIGSKIAIIDTGVDYNHPDLGGCFGPTCKVAFGFDFVNNDSDPMDDHGHGTHVAATAAGGGVLNGVAPDAKIFAYKVLDSTGYGFDSYIIAAIDSALDPNNDGDFSDSVDVISMSLGGYGTPDEAMSIAVDNAFSLGVVVVVAAGNSGPDARTIACPGCARDALTVGAIYKNYSIAPFSSRGPVVWSGGTLDKPDVVAPGVSICAAKGQGTSLGPACLDSKHISISGTSMATPHVAGVAAIIAQAHTSWNSSDIKNAIKSTAISLGYDIQTQGSGIVDTISAVYVSRSFEVRPFFVYLEEMPNNKIWNASHTFNIKNLGGSTNTLDISFETSIQGINASFSKNTTSIPGFGEDIFNLSLEVDNDLVSPGATYYVYVVVRNQSEVAKVPISIKINASLSHLPDVIDLGLVLPETNSSLYDTFTIRNLRQDSGVYLDFAINCCSIKDGQGNLNQIINYTNIPGFNIYFLYNSTIINAQSNFSNTFFLDIPASAKNGIYEGYIDVYSSYFKYKIPFRLAKFYLINISFEVDPLYVFVNKNDTLLNMYIFPGTNIQEYLDQKGVYHVYSFTDEYYTPAKEDLFYGVQNINLTGIENVYINNSALKNKIGVNYTDKDGNALSFSYYSGNCIATNMIGSDIFKIAIVTFSCENDTLFYVNNIDGFSIDYGLVIRPRGAYGPLNHTYFFSGNVSNLSRSYTFTNTKQDLGELYVNYSFLSSGFAPVFINDFIFGNGIYRFTFLYLSELENKTSTTVYVLNNGSIRSLFNTAISRPPYWVFSIEKETPYIYNKDGRFSLNVIKDYEKKVKINKIKELKNNFLSLGELKFEFWSARVRNVGQTGLRTDSVLWMLKYFLIQDLSSGYHSSVSYELYRNGILYSIGTLNGASNFGGVQYQDIFLYGYANYSLVASNNYTIGQKNYTSTINLSFDNSVTSNYIPYIKTFSMLSGEAESDVIYADKNLSFEFEIENETSVSLIISGDTQESYSVLEQNDKYNLDLGVPKSKIRKVGLDIYNYNSKSRLIYEFEVNHTLEKKTSGINLSLNNISGDIQMDQGEIVRIDSSLIEPQVGVIELYENGNLIENRTSPVSFVKNYSVAGSYNITSYFAGNKNYNSSYKTYFITIADTKAPQIINLANYPASPVVYSQNQVYTFNATIIDESAIYGVYLENDFVVLGQIVNTSVTKKVGNEYYFVKLTPIPAGNYTYNWIALDAYDNLAASGPQAYLVEKAQSTTFLSVSVDSPIIYGTFITVSCSSTNNQIIPKLYKDGLEIQQGTYLLTPGIYNFTCISLESQDYFGSSDSNPAYRVDKANPQIELKLNNIRQDVKIVQGGAVQIDGILKNPLQGDLILYQDGIEIALGANQISINQSYNIIGTYNITLRYIGDQNYSETFETHFIEVGNPPDTLSPTVLINSPQDNVITRNQQMQVTCEASDLVLLNNISLVIDGQIKQFIELNASFIVQTFTETLSEGIHTYFCEAHDNSSNKGISSIQTITIDITPPTLNITSPQPTVYNTQQINISYIIQGQDIVYYTLDNGQTNITLDYTPTTIQLGDGQYTLRIIALDRAGNYVMAGVTFRIDTSIAACTQNCKINITLVEGTNLISLPLIQENYSVGNIFASIMQDIDSIYTYSPSLLWRVYHTNQSRISTLNEIEPRKGYFVLTNRPSVLTLRGNLLPTPPLVLEPGWNLIGVHNLTNQAIDDVLIGLNYDSVWEFRSGIQSYNRTTNMLDYTRGYWVYII